MLICDCLGLSTSGGRLMSDLEREFQKQGIQIHPVFKSAPNKKMETKFVSKRNNSNFRRGIDEILLAFHLSLKILKIRTPNFIGVISYSPSIFLFIPSLIAKWKFGVRHYLIVRDIFPQWMLQTDAIKNGLVYKILLVFSMLSYRFASKIGVQSATDKRIVDKLVARPSKIEVLHNWRSVREYPDHNFSKDFSTDQIKILYAGNVGAAQRLDYVFDHLLALNSVIKIKISVYGFGRELEYVHERLKLSQYADNIEFFEPVSENELNLISQNFHYGLVALDDKLETGNIPGKILTYLNYQIPILGVASRKSELKNLIERENIGMFLSFDELANMKRFQICELMKHTQDNLDRSLLLNCLKNNFSSEAAVEKILKFFNKKV